MVILGLEHRVAFRARVAAAVLEGQAIEAVPAPPVVRERHERPLATEAVLQPFVLRRKYPLIQRQRHSGRAQLLRADKPF